MSKKYPYKLTYEDLAVIYRSKDRKLCGYLRNVHLDKGKLTGLCALLEDHCFNGSKECTECEFYKEKIRKIKD